LDMRQVGLHGGRGRAVGMNDSGQGQESQKTGANRDEYKV
jgi:hypothetical protein